MSLTVWKKNIYVYIWFKLFKPVETQDVPPQHEDMSFPLFKQAVYFNHTLVGYICDGRNATSL